jgi:hypothetical protein
MALPQSCELGHGARILLRAWPSTYPSMSFGTLKACESALAQTDAFLVRRIKPALDTPIDRSYRETITERQFWPPR